jgi:hypothetical protein
VREGYARFSERQDLEELRRDWISPDLEYVTRHGTFHGGSGDVVWKAWPAAVVRVLDGKLAFFEGYVDRRAALAALGVEQG